MTPTPVLTPAGTPADPVPSRPVPTGRRVLRVARSAAAGTALVLGAVLVLFTLAGPERYTHLTPAAFLRIPIEGLVLLALILVLPGRARSVTIVVAGVLLGLLSLIKILNIGFYTALARPFDPVLDWVLLRPAFGLVSSSLGTATAIAVTVGLGAVIIGVPVLMTFALRRFSRLALRHETAATRGTAVLVAVWALCAALNLQIVPDLPIASDSATGTVGEQVALVRRDLHDGERFATDAAFDAYAGTPADKLLTDLRGKDVLFAFVESYGRDAVQNPALSPEINATLDDGTRRLQAAGFGARSAFLTSPTTGGGSWLAHDTLLSGLWVNNQQRSDTLLASGRTTLNSAFRRAGWRTMAVMPANDRDWPEGAFFQYSDYYDSRNMGYRGPKFNYVPVPDQFTLAAFQRLARAPGHPPVMGEIPLVSSHAPWTPIPTMVGWDQVGDGTVYSSMSTADDPPDVVFRTSEKIKTAYRKSIQYSLNSLISYVETYGDDNLVLVFLGDHQPSPVVIGDNTSRDVPITIVAHDRKVLDQVSGWGWQDGLRPQPKAPVWPMSAFRDRFLTAFGP